MSEDTNKNSENDLEMSFNFDEFADLIEENEEDRETADFFYEEMQEMAENTQESTDRVTHISLQLIFLFIW